MKDFGLVSIIIPTYNSYYISESINSVINQTYKNWEIILVDDCSSDYYFEKLLKTIDNNKKIKTIRMKFNTGGPAIPRNEGLKNSNGKWIAFLDSDDIWHPDKLRLQIEIINKYDADMVCSNLLVFKKEISNFKKLNNCIKIQKVYLSTLLRNNIIANSSVFVRKKVLIDSGLYFNEKKEFSAVEDYIMWVHLLGKGISCIKIKENLLFYRVYNNNLSKSKISMLKKRWNVYNNIIFKSKKITFLNKITYMLIYIFSGLANVIKVKILKNH